MGKCHNENITPQKYATFYEMQSNVRRKCERKTVNAREKCQIVNGSNHKMYWKSFGYLKFYSKVKIFLSNCVSCLTRFYCSSGILNNNLIISAGFVNMSEN